MQRQTLHFLQLYLVFRKQPSYLHLCATFVSMFKGKWPTLSYLASTLTLFAPTPLLLGGGGSGVESQGGPRGSTTHGLPPLPAYPSPRPHKRVLIAIIVGV